MTMTRKECEDGLKTGIAALLLALLCWLLSGCTPGGIKMLCGDVNAAGKAGLSAALAGAGIVLLKIIEALPVLLSLAQAGQK